MSKTLKMIKAELPRTMGELDHQLLYDDICQAVKEVESLIAERDKFRTALEKIGGGSEDAANPYGLAAREIAKEALEI